MNIKIDLMKLTPMAYIRENRLNFQRRHFLTGVGALSLASLLSACDKSAISKIKNPQSKPNFLFLPIDDLNDWIGVLGTNANVKTPHIDALAGQSRASLMSGLLPHQTGIYGQVRDNKLRGAINAVSSTKFLSEYLKHKYFREGDFGPKPEKRMNWDSNRTHTDWGPYPARDEDMLDLQTANWGAEWLSKTHDEPFFLGLGMIRPHVPWHAPQKWFDLYPLEDIELPPWLETDMEDIPQAGIALTHVPQMPTVEWAIEHDEWRPILQAYLASISFVDHCIGIALPMRIIPISFYSLTMDIIWVRRAALPKCLFGVGPHAFL